MEKRINDKISQANLSFKSNIAKWFTEKGHTIIDESGIDVTSNFLKTIYDMEHFNIPPEDFQKKKRTRVIIPDECRCTAKRATGEQCSRRRKPGHTMCGTHHKGKSGEHMVCHKPSKVKTRTTIYMGIHYHIDDNNNVYLSEDIIKSVENPRRIGTWSLDERGALVVSV
jgi:hypothetical protein